MLRAEKKTKSTPAGEPYYGAAMSARTFERFSSFIEDSTGIKMPPAKRTMLEGRLRKRMRKLGLGSFEAYADMVFTSGENSLELVNLIDAVTTNKTDFFREPGHFDYLVKNVLPEHMTAAGHCSRQKLKVWSAGCSTGEEPYTLAIVLSEFAEQHKSFDFSILATDISTRVLDKAVSGVYDAEKIVPVPQALRKKYLLRGKGEKQHLVRIVPELRSRVKFQQLNFMDSEFGIRDRMNVIFCRNVIIYFERAMQEQLLNKFCRYLAPGGYIFMGHSETLSGLNVPLVQVSTTVYRMANQA